jgi:hypothetical protein
MTGNGSVGHGSFTSGNVPGVTHHKFKVVVFVDASAHIGVVVDPFLFGDLAVARVVPLAHEFHKHFFLGGFS